MKVKSKEKRKAIENICNNILFEHSDSDHGSYVTSIFEILKKNEIEMKIVTKNFFIEKLNLDAGALALFRKNDDKNIILLNVDEYPKKEDKIFTLAHELGHYFLHMEDKKNYLCYRHKKGITPEEKKYEDESDYFASCLLMPKNKIIKAIEKFPDVVSVDSLSKLFEVSPEAMKKRLEELEITLGL